MKTIKRVLTIPSFLHVKYYLIALWHWMTSGFRFASDEQAHMRHSICETCPGGYFARIDGEETCEACRCWVSLEKGLDRAYSKIYFSEERCPKGHW